MNPWMHPVGMPAMPTQPTFQELQALAPHAGPGSELYRLVEDQMGRIANFTFFSMPNPAQPNVPLMQGQDLIGVEVHEALHRMDIVQRATPSAIEVHKVIGEPTAQVHMTWRPIPDDLVATPDGHIPPTPFDPTRPQRFTMKDGTLSFEDSQGSGIHGFGTGSTYPVRVAGKTQVRLAAIIDVVSGFGQLAGHQGMLIVNGHIEPPTELALNITLRLTDPSGQFLPNQPIPPVHSSGHTDPDDVYMLFHAESDPHDPVQLRIDPSGRMLGARGPQRMRLAHVAYTVEGPDGIRTVTTLGDGVGHMDAMAHFDPFTGSPPHPFTTTDGVFTFHTADGRPLGTLDANMQEGRALPTHFPGAPLPVYRVGGIAPVTRGTGIFENVVGLFTVDSFISLVPNVISGIFVLHISDPSGRLRSAL